MVDCKRKREGIGLHLLTKRAPKQIRERGEVQREPLCLPKARLPIEIGIIIMKNNKIRRLGLLLVAVVVAGASHVAAQGTAFTYQGQLNSGANAVTGLYDFEFTLSNAPSGGTQVGGTLTNLAVGVSNGLFTTVLDFGSVFGGSPLWLGISVRSNGSGSYTGLTPPEELTPAPYAILAESASGMPGLTVQPNASSGAPNLIGGSPYNYASGGVIGATVGGGGATNYTQGPHHYQWTNGVTGSFGTVGGGAQNTAGNYATVGGGQQNTANGQLSTVAGGFENVAIGSYATVAGGVNNVASNSSLGSDTVGGGMGNTANGGDSTVGGGFNNQATNSFAVVAGGANNVAGGAEATVSGGSGNHATTNFATVPGGDNNLAGGQYSFAAGNSAQATNDSAFVWADTQATPFGSTTSNQFSVRAYGGVRFVTGGTGMTVDGQPVLTNNVANAVFGNLMTTGNLTMYGNLTLGDTAEIYSDGGTLLLANANVNFFAGQSAGVLAPGAYGNTGIGGSALANNTGSYNTATGDGALQENTSGINNTAAGMEALTANTNGNQNVAIGASALSFNRSGSDNVAVGYSALYLNTNQSQETAVGSQALYNNTSGFEDTGIGYRAMLNNQSGSQNTASGVAALEANTIGSDNTASGAFALNTSSTGSYNTADGAYALRGTATTGGGNTGSGAYTIFGLTTGYNNTAAGYKALYSDTTGFENVGIGMDALPLNADGFQNTAVGTYSLQIMTAGTGNIAIGCGAGNRLVAGTNNLYIGNGGSSADNEVIRIGSGQTATYLAGARTYVNGAIALDGSDTNNGLVYTASSGLPGINSANGPFLYGWNGGALGSVSPNTVCLSWDWTGDVWVSNNLTTATLTIRGGSDLAEPFKIISGNKDMPEGSVVVIDEKKPGQLKVSTEAYDTRVAGVLSGANGIHPGIQMQQEGLLEGGKNVALTGRVYVLADAANGAIQPGDLLTTSDTPGHAMKVSDHAKAQGAILGKAMSGLKKGRGMVLVLVTLQ